jgi:hypothetical protein
MDSEELSYEDIIKFFDKYFDKKEIPIYSICKKCIKLIYIEFAFRDSIDYSNCNFLCPSVLCNSEIPFKINKKSLYTENVFPDLSTEEINVIIKLHTYQSTENIVYIYCNICKYIRVIDIYYFGETIIKNEEEYFHHCDNCDKIYPECCIDYYKFPLKEEDNYLEFRDYKNDICIDCFNETTEIYLKPAKK